MASKTPRARARKATPASLEDCTLRAAVLRLGGQLGWSPSVVAGFTEGVTGRPWAQCGPTEWWAVLEEYRGILAVIAAKRARAAAESGAKEGEHDSGR